ncbi:class I SAM-dependent methyltransferase [Actimicrobium antarcticum]|uniref:Class I SAM-dependent methyltransferase n=1 Tax=Actimicrobium antarcticum TaxID=1051899 RepID=A0ABP7SSU9_9BURK
MSDNPVRGRLNAWLLQTLDGYMHQKYAAIKSGLLADVPAVVVELGSGTGANMRYLPAGTRLIAIEPNRQMHAALRAQATNHGIDLQLHDLMAESLDMPSDSVDLVFATLVLCTVDQPQRVIAEVLRVLRPGGRFVCIEHVAAPAGSGERVLQQTIRQPWHWLFEGCNLCRDTGAVLRSAGFSHVDVQPIILPTLLVPIRHQIIATCVK